jgi:hypothetical protein
MSQPPSQGNAEESCTARKLPQFDATGQSALTSERAETVGVPARSVSPFLEQVEQPSNLSVESPQQDTQKPVCEKSFSKLTLFLLKVAFDSFFVFSKFNEKTHLPNIIFVFST